MRAVIKGTMTSANAGKGSCLLLYAATTLIRSQFESELQPGHGDDIGARQITYLQKCKEDESRA
jgi:hypothetical protein